MFLVNSRYPHFSAAQRCSFRKGNHITGHTFSRSYGIILPSSLRRLLSNALGYSPRPPESVCGTVNTAINSTGAFLGSLGSFSSRARMSPPHHLSGLMLSRLSLLGPKRAPYEFEPRPEGQAIMGMNYPSPSPLWKSSVLVQECSPVFHQLRLSASP